MQRPRPGLAQTLSTGTVVVPVLPPDPPPPPPTPPTYDFTLGSSGSTRCWPGFDTYRTIVSALTIGTRDYAFYSVNGMPAGMTVSYPSLEEFCCGGNKAWQPDNTPMKLSLTGAVTPGTYPLTLVSTSHGVTKEHLFSVIVAAPVTVSGGPPGSPPAIPSLSTADTNLATYATQHCTEPLPFPGETYSWYYDGLKVYWFTDDRLGGDRSACRTNKRSAYRDYVVANNGGVPGYRVFPHGFYLDWQRLAGAQQAVSLNALDLLKNSAYANLLDGSRTEISREVAYVVSTHRLRKAAGFGTHVKYSRAVSCALGHLDQWFVSATSLYMQPFMVGLTMEALIQYYDRETADTRIPELIKVACDGLWTGGVRQAWVPANASFWYESSNPTTGAPDLNMLLAHAYAWLYKLTGTAGYQDKADQIFVGAVNGAFLAGGKQWSQFYRLFFDFVAFRNAAAIVSP